MKKTNNHWLINIGFFFLLSVPSLAQLPFTEVTREAGINHGFTVFQGTFGGGAAVIDFDGDGWEDLFLAGGAGDDQLLRNLGNGTFQHVTDAGLEVLSNLVTQGAAVADVNKDGWQDLFVTTIAVVNDDDFTEAPDVLLINNGDGSFSDASISYGISKGTFSMGAAFGDVNKDGFPDLHISNYFDRFEGKLDQYSGPLTSGDVRPGTDQLYINVNGKQFREVSVEYGMERAGLTFQGLWSDYDNDRDLDLLVINDFGNRQTPNLLYRNDFPEAQFTEVGSEEDFDFGINGMGIDACDINLDGFMDYLITNIQVSPFLVNGGDGRPFTEHSVEYGTGFETVSTDEGFGLPPVSWGVNFFDADHDLDPDVFISNGCLNPQLAPNPSLLLQNDNSIFREVGSLSNMNDHSIGRGSLIFDYDHDGDMDLLIINQLPYQDEDVGIRFNGHRLFRNDNESGTWIKIALKGSRSESFGIGSRIEVSAGDKMIAKEVYGGSSHMSQNSLITHFGTGSNQSVDITVKWSSGLTQTVSSVNTNQTITINEEDILQDLPENNFVAFPSAFADQLNIQYELTSASEKVKALEMLDISGKILTNFTESQSFGSFGLISLDGLDHLTPGIYILRMVATNGVTLQKVVKQ